MLMGERKQETADAWKVDKTSSQLCLNAPVGNYKGMGFECECVCLRKRERFYV